MNEVAELGETGCGQVFRHDVSDVVSRRDVGECYLARVEFLANAVELDVDVASLASSQLVLGKRLSCVVVLEQINRADRSRKELGLVDKSLEKRTIAGR